MAMTLAEKLRRGFPTFHRLIAPFQWIGRDRRRAMGATIVLLAFIAAPCLWWEMQLWGLPDVGVPFVVEALERSVPDDRNAFTVYAGAASLLTEPYRYTKNDGHSQADRFASWSKTSPEIRRWARDNRTALEWFRKGVERPDAYISPVQGKHDKMGWHLECFRQLARLEASRLEENGDMAGAWGWYRAVLRMIYQCSMHATRETRWYGLYWHNDLLKWLGDWAADPRTSPELLRRALDDVAECDRTMVPSDVDMIKLEHLALERWIDDPEAGWPYSMESRMHQPPRWFAELGKPGIELPPYHVEKIWRVWRFLRRDQERSRRVLRLLTANWLFTFDRPPDDRPVPILGETPFFIYPVGPDAPAAARAVKPEALDRWLSTTSDALQGLEGFGWHRLSAIRAREIQHRQKLPALFHQELQLRETVPDWPFAP